MPGPTSCNAISATAALVAGARFAAVLAALAAISPAAGAAIVKCATDDGGLMYQDAPCPPGRELRNFDTDPPTLSVIPGTPAPAAARASPPPDRPAASPDKPAKRTSAVRGDRSSGALNEDAAARKFIRTGMTDAEVRAKLGPPDITAGSSRNHSPRWSYLPTEGDPDTITTITFSGNTVSDVSRKVVKR
jgi:hypothetical protein